MKKIYLIAVVIALAAGLATYFFANELKTSKVVTGVDEAVVLIALQDIDENTILTADMFREVKIPASGVSYGTVSKAEDIVGYMAGVKILKGEQLMAGKLIPVGQKTAKGRLSYQLENGMYAYTITVEIEDGVAYFIKEYDCINIYDKLSGSAVPALENIPVIKISDYTANIQQDNGTEITSYSVLTLALTKEQIPKLMSINDYRIVLVSFAESNNLEGSIADKKEPATNQGMGESTTAPPSAE